MKKIKNHLQTKKRSYSKIFGTKENLRLSVFRSRKHIYAQLINDETRTTIVSFNSLNLKKNELLKKQPKLIISYSVGENLGKRAKILNISKVTFDRNHYIYHGRIKKLAEGARNEGLLF